jgi:hypothetical protein
MIEAMDAFRGPPERPPLRTCELSSHGPLAVIHDLADEVVEVEVSHGDEVLSFALVSGRQYMQRFGAECVVLRRADECEAWQQDIVPVGGQYPEQAFVLAETPSQTQTDVLAIGATDRGIVIGACGEHVARVTGPSDRLRLTSERRSQQQDHRET